MNPLEAIAGALASGSYTAGWAVVKGLPEPVARRLFDAGADLAVLRGGAGIDRLRANLARVAPGEELIREAVRSYARYWCEAFRLPALRPERILEGTVAPALHLLTDSVASGRGTVMALSHSGNWDMAGAWAGLSGIRFTTVAERLKPESVFEKFVAFRESLGMEVLPLTGGERPPYEVLTERLRAGGSVCLLADRDLTPRGIDVEFFGATARMPAGPARLALQTGANLLPVTLSFTPDGWELAFHPYVAHTDLPTMTQDVARAFEKGIREHPADWHMLQRLWLDDLAVDDPRRQRQGTA
ncbi:MAG: phosphatidylinositol mannoside acyltransferase [Mycobacteriales bacterium]